DFEARLVVSGPNEVLAIVRNITERKRAEAALKQNEEKYRAVVEQSANCIFLVDVESRRILEANSALQHLLGYSYDEIINLTLYDFIFHPQYEIDQNIQRILARGNYFLGERRYRRKDGLLIDVEVGVTLISYGAKEIMCVVSRDVTERKRAQKALREVEERLHTVINNSPIIMSALDHEGVFTLSEGKGLETIGRKPGQVVGQSIFEV
ncbi:MAG: PAS domain S-box protein, partial [Proteobacteria bacterium]|nr:PAS domain S-box protein [Pseudomonadota bacterium]